MITFSQLGRYGRFANQLFQIAGTIGLATKHGYSYAFPKWINHDHKDRFGSSEDIDLQKYFVNPLPTTDVSLTDFPISWGYHHEIHVPDGVSLSGHMQSEKYFKHCISMVRHYLRMKDESKTMGEFCAVHIRRGDYDDKYHTVLKRDYYAEAVKQFPKETIFILFSDDQVAAEALFDSLDRPYAISASSYSYLKDFASMKTFPGFICANSSYSLMAAILSETPDKKIVCPSQWFGPAWTPETKDLYPENAIVI
jgi:hypothetical protein